MSICRPSTNYRHGRYISNLGLRLGFRGDQAGYRLDHLSITYPSVQSNWHVNWQAKDLGSLEAGSIMLARCLALMQHCRCAADRRSGLLYKLVDLERTVG